MKKKIIVLFLLFISSNYLFSQVHPYLPDAFSETYTYIKPQNKIQSIPFTGDFTDLVIAVGFPDRAPTYPQITNNSSYPKLGVFRNGTLLRDYITQQGGSISLEEWYEPAFDTYFDTHSGGIYNVDFIFVKRPNGNPYTTINNYSHFRTLNNGSDINVFWNKWNEIMNEVAENMITDDPNIFNDVDAVHVVFNVSGNQKNEFHIEHGGTVKSSGTLKNTLGQILYSGPLSIQWNVDAVIHERLHIIGAISGTPSGFVGFPDRGFDRTQTSHSNLTGNYDMMYHSGNSIPAEYSLFGLPPINSHDLMFLEWIKADEIIEINSQSLDQVKLADVNYPLTIQQKNDNFYRVAKIMLHENYSGDLDEYLLLEFHNATEFDKNNTNYDNDVAERYNKGLLIWHVKETRNLLGWFQDNLIDIEIAVPYNGFNVTPEPNDSYPRNYNRPSNWNGINSGDFDYLDDLHMTRVAPGD